jgi:phage terminase large subunit-like protein
MARPRKTIDELKQSGKWLHMSVLERDNRLREERIADQQAADNLRCDLDAAKAAGDEGMAELLAAIVEDHEPPPTPESVRPTLESAPPAQPKPSPTRPPIPDAAVVSKAYASDIATGSIVAGKYLRMAAKRFLADLERTDILFDATAAQHVVDYIARLGLDLLPWQVFILANLFGFKLPSGLRRFRYAFVLVAKKNGKTCLSAALGLYMSDPLGDGEPYAASYCAATTRYQSQSLCFKAACRIRDENPHIKETTKKWLAKTSIVWPNDSSFEPLAANSEKLNGLNIHFGSLDELGDHPTSDLHNVFVSSTTGRKQPLIISITTAGENREQIAYEVRNRAAQVLDGTIPGDSFFAYIAELDEGDKPEDESVWIKANPSLGVLVPIENIRDLAQAAAAIPSTKRAFLRYSFNIWPATSLTSWISVDDLNARGCAYLTDEGKTLTPGKRIAAAEEKLQGTAMWSRDLSKLSDGQLAELSRADTQVTCYAGLDLAMVNDLSALCLLFPPNKADGIWQALFRVWCPEEAIVRRSKEQRVPYQAWADSSFIKPTPGDVTDNSFILGEILNLRKKFQIKELGFDRAMALDLTRSLEQAGMKVTQVAQGFGLSPAINRMAQLIVARKFCTFGQPVANWCFSNVSLAYGFKGDARMERIKSREKIDCAVAATIAMQVVLSQSNPVTAIDVTESSDRMERLRVKYI